MDQRQREKFDPRSPVQPGTKPAPYFLIAVAAAVMFWGFEQNWGPDVMDSVDESASQSAAPVGMHAGARRQQSPSGDVRTVFSSDDYPASAMANGEEGTVRAQLTLDKSGRVERCDVISSSGHQSLDRATCSILQQRARFVPARNANGDAVESTYLTPPIAWRLANG